MNIVTLLAVAVALAADAFAVAVASGVRLQSVSVPQTVRMAGAFGLFQFLMPVIGWFCGAGAQKYIESYDHWVAFALLAFVGGKMLKEAWESRGKPQEDCRFADPTQGLSLLMPALATSIDALAVGMSMAMLQQPVLFPAVVIGVVCFLVTACGMHLGAAAGCAASAALNRGNVAARAGGDSCASTAPASLGTLGNLGMWVTVLGGFVLIGIGLGILHEHSVW